MKFIIKMTIFGLLVFLLFSCGGNSGCGTGGSSDFRMNAEYPTPCPMPNIQTVSLDPDIAIQSANYYDGWYLKHQFTQVGNYNCIHENYYKNGQYNLDMPQYNLFLFQEERPNNDFDFTLEITLQAPIGYSAGAVSCECPEGYNAANTMWKKYTDVYLVDIYEYYNQGVGPGFNESYAWFHLIFGGCQNLIFTNENVLSH